MRPSSLFGAKTWKYYGYEPKMAKAELSIHKWKYRWMAQSAVGLLLLSALLLCCGAQTIETCAAQRVFGKADALLKLKHYEEAEAVLHPLQDCHNLTDIERFSLG